MKSGMKVVATDGHRLAKSELSTPLEIESQRQVILPRKAVTELLRFLGDGDDAAQLDINPNHIRVSTEAWVFRSEINRWALSGLREGYPAIFEYAPGGRQASVDRNIGAHSNSHQ